MNSDSRPSVAAELYAGPGLIPFGVGLVVKFGGSLMGDVDVAARLAREFVALHPVCPLVIVPGGGPTDKLIESIAARAGLRDEVINPACMRAMDQTGILLASLAPGLLAVENLAAVRRCLAAGTVPVLLPGALILSLDVFTRQSVITSDTLGAYFAFLLGAPAYVVLTDVDGVYERFDKQHPEGLLAACTTAELERLGATSVDRCFAPFLQATRMPAWVLNGRFPERLGELVRGGTPRGTRVIPSLPGEAA